MEREAGGSCKREGTYVYLWLIHVVAWQKPIQYPKAIILQLKVNKLKKLKGSKILLYSYLHIKTSPHLD